MSAVKSIMIVGVGGQGTLLASRILGRVLLDRGYDVKLSEVHGMSQRGGSVVTYVRYGERVYSPMVEKGEADFVLSFEELESARWIPYLKKDGVLITNTQRMDPMPVITGQAEYPDALGMVRAAGARVVEADALSIAEKAGSVRAVNVALIGVLSAMTDIPEGEWEAAIRATVPAKFTDVNLAAFRMGRQSQE